MRILVTGATGQLGTSIFALLSEGPHDVIGWSRVARAKHGFFPVVPVDLTDHTRVNRELRDLNPDVIIHTAAVSSADAVLRDPAHAYAVNVRGTECIVDWASNQVGKRVIYTSTDLVFDGTRPWNDERSPTNPLLEYGRSKLAAEPCVLSLEGGLVARLSLLYGMTSSEHRGFFQRSIETLRQGAIGQFFEDEFRTPLDYRSAAQILVLLAESNVGGLVHVGGAERISRYELMSQAADHFGIDRRLVRSNLRQFVELVEPRPEDVSLNISRLQSILPSFVFPTIEQALSTPESKRASALQ